MAFEVDELGNITLVQGDSGKLVVEGLDTFKNYTVYFAIQDKKRKPIGTELSVNSEYASSIVFEIKGSLTNLLTVNKNNETETYYYGVKVCDPEDGFEDTLTIGESEMGDLNSIIVYPRKVEGI
jgi:hypothetical protein